MYVLFLYFFFLCISIMFTTLFFPLFLVFFLVAFLSSIVSRFGLVEPEMEMQPNSYQIVGL